jgi:hypothetical protein
MAALGSRGAKFIPSLEGRGFLWQFCKPGLSVVVETGWVWPRRPTQPRASAATARATRLERWSRADNAPRLSKLFMSLHYYLDDEASCKNSAF